MRLRLAGSRRIPPMLVPAALLAVTGCAGNGEGLDANGRPLGEGGSDGGSNGGPPGGPPPAGGEFRQIQDTIFTPICTNCHAGAAAPLGLRLDEANSYAMLVDVPSVQVPTLRRVAPGDPESSYLVQKLEGRAAVGARMPLGGPPLPQSSIDLVRQWIAQGAPPATAGLAEQMQAPRVVSTVPADGERSAAVSALTVVFSHPIDAALASTDTFRLHASGGDGSFAEGNEIAVPLASVEVSLANPTVVTLTPRSALTAETYRVTVSGSGAVALADVDARVLDGDDDGVPGGDFHAAFTVTEGAP